MNIDMGVIKAVPQSLTEKEICKILYYLIEAGINTGSLEIHRSPGMYLLFYIRDKESRKQIVVQSSNNYIEDTKADLISKIITIYNEVVNSQNLTVSEYFD